MEFKYNGKHKRGWKKNHHHDDRWEKPYDPDVDMSGDRGGRPDRRHDPYMNHHQKHKNKKKNKQIFDDPHRWYKVTVNFTQELEKSFIIRSITNLCDSAFSPVNFTQNESRSVFYVQGSKVAHQIKQCNCRITKPDGKKLAIHIDPVSSPPSTPLTEEQVEHLKLYMSTNYDTATRTLTLVGLHLDPDLQQKKLFFPLEDNNTLKKVVDIITAHIPELEHLSLENNNLYHLMELERLVLECPNLASLNLSRNKIRKAHQLEPLRGLELKELNMENTTLAMTFRQKWDQYVSLLRDYFPNLVKLDGKEIPPPIGFETGEALPKCMPSFFLDESVQPLIVDFVKRFYTIFDNSDRQELLSEYHSQAFLSLSVPRIANRAHVPQDFHAENRNLQANSDQKLRTRLLRQGNLNAVATLTELPKTVHHPATFMVDVSHVSAQLMTFNINGLFNIVSDKPGGRLLSFTRSLAVVPTPLGKFSIINDLLVVAPATVAQARALKKASLPPVAPVVASPLRDQLVLQLSQHTNMNIPYSTKCLEESNWNIETALSIFTLANAAGKIPPEAFQL